MYCVGAIALTCHLSAGPEMGTTAFFGIKALCFAKLRKVLHGLMETVRPNLPSPTVEHILRDGNLLGVADVLTGVVPLLPGVANRQVACV